MGEIHDGEGGGTTSDGGNTRWGERGDYLGWGEYTMGRGGLPRMGGIHGGEGVFSVDRNTQDGVRDRVGAQPIGSSVEVAHEHIAEGIWGVKTRHLPRAAVGGAQVSGM